MSKRFTDTTKWEDHWFRELPMKMKLAWFYVLDKCDQAGIWKSDFKLMSFFIGNTITEKEFQSTFCNRVDQVGSDKYLIKKFIQFQYGELTEKNTMYKKVQQCLALIDHVSPIPSPMVSPIDGVKDKEEDKDKEKEELNLDILYQKYPLKRGKALGLARLKKIILTPEDFSCFSKAVDLYTADLEKSGTKPEHIKHFSTFVGSGECQPWRDWLEPDAGKASTHPHRATPTVVSDLPREYP